MKQLLLTLIVFSILFIYLPNEVKCLTLRKFGVYLVNHKINAQTQQATDVDLLRFKLIDNLRKLKNENEKQSEEQRRKIIQSHLGANIGHKSVMNDFYSRF